MEQTRICQGNNILLLSPADLGAIKKPNEDEIVDTRGSKKKKRAFNVLPTCFNVGDTRCVH